MERSLEFSGWIDQQLAEREWNQADLAKRSGIKQPQISRVMNGTRKASPDFCRGVAQAFGLPPDLVFREAGLLPPEIETDSPFLEEINYLLPGLTESKQAEIIEYVRMQVRIAEERGEYRGATEANPST